MQTLLSLVLLLTSSVASAQTSATYGELLAPRYGSCAAYVPEADRVYVIGGVGLYSASNEVQALDPQTLTVSVAAYLPAVTYTPRCAAAQGLVWIWDDGSSSLYSFDPVAGTVSTVSSGALYTSGGMASDGERLYLPTNAGVTSFEIATGVWSDLPAPAFPRYVGPKLVASHGWLWLIGGSLQTTVVERLDLSNPVAWERFGSLTEQLVHLSGGVLGDVVILNGDEGYSGTTARVFEFDLTTGRTRTSSEYLPFPLSYRAGAAVDGGVWFFGGRETSYTYAFRGDVSAWWPTTTGPDNDGDGVIDRFDDDDDDDGLIDWQDPCPMAAVAPDSDGDGVCDPSDACPLDPDDDLDGDGVCGDEDLCPLDPEDDSDLDGSCDSVDLCVGDDGFDDVDEDGVCGDLDPCPLDLFDDSDGDGACDGVDFCEGDDLTGDGDGDGVCNDEDFLLLVTPMRRGQPARFAVYRAQPGASVQIWGTTRGLGVGPCPTSSVCGSLNQPIRLGVVTASASGEAVLNVVVPATLPVGLDLLIEAAWVRQGQADVSGVVHRRVLQ
jgi:hypothetical protein